MVHWLALRPWCEIRGGRESHARAQSFSVPHNREATVVAGVGPFVRVGGPRIGVLESIHQVPVHWRRTCPQAECTIHVDPGALLVRGCADGSGGIECSGVDVTSLNTNDRAPREFG